MTKNFKTIKDIINENEFFRNLRRLAIYAEITEKFYKIFKDLEGIVTIEKIENDIIFFRADDAVWRNELLILKKKIIDKINKKFNSEIKDIKFV